ncbi:unnamed protein product [Prorocentrum cordatum]|uniref:Reverse transcriptase domain-containing protein n=1 Tax=Prorocentrum cordatum TaxID=2364126 RepID=A0ABN9S7E1_9DINO|nr:unnamed protein product [Polarella glacialis]
MGDGDPSIRTQTRDPASTRPLTFSKTVNQIIAAALAAPLARASTDLFCGIQQGFVPGRQGLEHIIDVDSVRAILSEVEFEQECGACCFDMKTAFPSLHVHWIEHVLEKIGVPSW